MLAMPLQLLGLHRIPISTNHATHNRGSLDAHLSAALALARGYAAV